MEKTSRNAKIKRCQCCNKSLMSMTCCISSQEERRCTNCNSIVCKKCYSRDNTELCCKCAIRNKHNEESLQTMDEKALKKILQDLHFNEQEEKQLKKDDLVNKILEKCQVAVNKDSRRQQSPDSMIQKTSKNDNETSQTSLPGTPKDVAGPSRQSGAPQEPVTEHSRQRSQNTNEKSHTSLQGTPEDVTGPSKPSRASPKTLDNEDSSPNLRTQQPTLPQRSKNNNEISQTSLPGTPKDVAGPSRQSGAPQEPVTEHSRQQRSQNTNEKSHTSLQGTPEDVTGPSKPFRASKTLVNKDSRPQPSPNLRTQQPTLPQRSKNNNENNQISLSGKPENVAGATRPISTFQAPNTEHSELPQSMTSQQRTTQEITEEHNRPQEIKTPTHDLRKSPVDKEDKHFKSSSIEEHFKTYNWEHDGKDPKLSKTDIGTEKDGVPVQSFISIAKKSAELKRKFFNEALPKYTTDGNALHLPQTQISHHSQDSISERSSANKSKTSQASVNIQHVGNPQVIETLTPQLGKLRDKHSTTYNPRHWENPKSSTTDYGSGINFRQITPPNYSEINHEIPNINKGINIFASSSKVQQITEAVATRDIKETPSSSGGIVDHNNHVINRKETPKHHKYYNVPQAENPATTTPVETPPLSGVLPDDIKGDTYKRDILNDPRANKLPKSGDPPITRHTKEILPNPPGLPEEPKVPKESMVQKTENIPHMIVEESPSQGGVLPYDKKGDMEKKDIPKDSGENNILNTADQVITRDAKEIPLNLQGPPENTTSDINMKEDFQDSREKPNGEESTTSDRYVENTSTDHQKQPWNIPEEHHQQLPVLHDVSAVTEIDHSTFYPSDVQEDTESDFTPREKIQDPRQMTISELKAFLYIRGITAQPGEEKQSLVGAVLRIQREERLMQTILKADNVRDPGTVNKEITAESKEETDSNDEDNENFLVEYSGRESPATINSTKESSPDLPSLQEGHIEGDVNVKAEPQDTREMPNPEIVNPAANSDNDSPLHPLAPVEDKNSNTNRKDEFKDARYMTIRELKAFLEKRGILVRPGEEKRTLVHAVSNIQQQERSKSIPQHPAVGTEKSETTPGPCDEKTSTVEDNGQSQFTDQDNQGSNLEDDLAVISTTNEIQDSSEMTATEFKVKVRSNSPLLNKVSEADDSQETIRGIPERTSEPEGEKASTVDHDDHSHPPEEHNKQTPMLPTPTFSQAQIITTSPVAVPEDPNRHTNLNELKDPRHMTIRELKAFLQTRGIQVKSGEEKRTLLHAVIKIQETERIAGKGSDSESGIRTEDTKQNNDNQEQQKKEVWDEGTGTTANPKKRPEEETSILPKRMKSDEDEFNFGEMNQPPHSPRPSSATKETETHSAAGTSEKFDVPGAESHQRKVSASLMESSDSLMELTISKPETETQRDVKVKTDTQIHEEPVLQAQQDPLPMDQEGNQEDKPMEVDRVSMTTEHKPQEQRDLRRVASILDIESISEIPMLSIKQLKVILQNHSVWSDVIQEKSEMVLKVEQLFADVQKRGRGDIPDEDLCRICMSNYIDCAVIECGHASTCSACGKLIEECPVCREYKVGIIRLFRVEQDPGNVSDGCMICKKATINCTLLPCGHMATCYDCGWEIKFCPYCQEYIKKPLRVYKV